MIKKLVPTTSKLDKQDRKFKKPNSISGILKCSICMDVFHEPTRLFCGHTFCLDCIDGWVKSNHLNCPICRQKINLKNLGTDRLAHNIIKDLEVFCIQEDCSWTGILELLELHVDHECLHRGSNKDRKNMKNTATEYKVVDEEVEQKINQHTGRGNLLSRIMQKDDSMRSGFSFDMANRIIKTGSTLTENDPPGQRVINVAKDKVHKENQQKVSQYENFDYLLQLYESSK